MNTLTPEIVTETPDLETMKRGDSLVIWNQYKADFEKLKGGIEAVLASDPSLPANSKIAREHRLAIRAIRIAATKKHQEMKEGILQQGRELDSKKARILELIQPYESQLQAIEDHAERVEAERVKKLAADRTAELSKYTTISNAVDYGAMPDEEFDKMLSDAKALHELRQAEAKRAEEARIAKEKAEAEERERVRVEFERLKKEAAEKEAALAAERAKVEADRRTAEEKARVEREAIEAKARAEREALEAKARAEAEEAEKKATAERARLREIAEKAEAERRELEAKVAAEKAAEEKKRKAEELARKKAAAAPDKEKLAAFVIALNALEIPEFATEEGRSVGRGLKARIYGLTGWIEEEATSL